MRGEHGMLLALFDHVEDALARSPSDVAVRCLAQVVGAVLLTHARHEDELLFPALDAWFGRGGPLAVMRSEHEDIDVALAGAVGIGTVAVVTAHLRSAIELARRHFAKEEALIFWVADDAVGADDLTRLGARWAAECGVSVAVSVHAPPCADGR